ncbi:MAG: NAD-dependent epimerase/dehydratase family protein [Candidatus Atribacteria bacterium]|nr:NAD-dependent epimerase/dehydratase family protein [Candidatus Atribacteria bacterium]
MPKILVTGGAGFIGSHVVDVYLRSGYDVVVVDSLSTGRRENLNPHARFYQIDIRSTAEIDDLFQKEQFDSVNHHAAQINLRRSVEEPFFDASVNILGTINLLEMCKKYRVKKCIFASTGGAIYGEPPQIPVDENVPAEPLSPYGIAKRSVELYLAYYRVIWGLDSIVLRYGNVYGPRQDPLGEAGVIAIFCGRILNNLPCVIFGDGRKTRDYVFVEDIAEASLLALRAPSGIYNLGTGKETSVLQLLETLQKISQRNVAVQFDPERKGEINRIALSTEKVRRTMGWIPHVSLEEGMERTFSWFAEGGFHASHGA